MSRKYRTQVDDPTAGRARAQAFGGTGGDPYSGAPRIPQADTGALFEALAGFTRAGVGFMQDRAKRKAAAQEMEGQRLYLENNRKAFHQAVKEGLIDPGANPHLVRGYQAASARSATMDYEFAAKKALWESELRDSDDPEQVNAFLNTFTGQYIKDRGLDTIAPDLFVEHLEPGLASAQKSILDGHATRRQNARIDEYEAAAGNLFMNLIDTALERGSSAEELAGAFSAEMTDMYMNGFPGSQIHTKAAKSIAQAAIDYDAPEILALADQINTGNGPLSRVLAAREILSDAEETIHQRRVSRENHEWSTEQRQHDKAAWNAQARALKDWQEQGDAWVREDFQTQANRMGATTPDEVKALQQLRSSITSAEAVAKDDEETVQFLTERLYRDPQTFDPNLVYGAMQRGEITTTTARHFLDNNLKLRDSYEHPFFNNPAFKAGFSEIDKHYGVTDSHPYPEEIRENIAVASRVKYLLRDRMSSWLLENPNASFREFDAEQERLKNELLTKHRVPEAPTDGGSPSREQFKQEMKLRTDQFKKGAQIQPRDAFKLASVAAAEQQHILGPTGAALVLAIMEVESGFKPTAVSNKGAQGLMQTLPGTFREMGGRNPNDLQENVLAGTRYLAKQIKEFGSLPLALAGYNAGPGNVKKYGNKVPPFPETQAYVTKVLAAYKRNVQKMKRMG